MEKTSLAEIKSDIKYKRDTLHLAHEDLKRQGDFWNKIIIFVSLGSSLFESTKMTMKWNDPALNLFPIFLSSIIAGISSFVKFKRYNEQQEVLIQSCTVLTSTLAKARNSTVVDEDLLREYHEGLELLETSLYPDVRKRYLKASQKNLVSIISNEDDYFDLIKKAKKGEDISDYKSVSSSTTTSQENIKRFQNEKEIEITDGLTIEEHAKSNSNVPDEPVVSVTDNTQPVSDLDMEESSLEVKTTTTNNISIKIDENT